MSDYILDGSYLTPVQVGTQRYNLPFSQQGDQTTLIYEIDYQQQIDYWVPLAANSLHPSVPSAYLIGETELLPINAAGIIQWTRRYATVPITRDIGGSISYQFPGLFKTTTLRLPFTWTVACRISLVYYLVGTGTPYPTVLSLPVTQRTRYYIGSISGGVGTDVETLASGFSILPSTPTTETYQGWISAGTQVVAESTQFSLWQGNIWQSATKYITAQ